MIRKLKYQSAWVLIALLAFAASGCASSSYLSVRRVPKNPLENTLQLLSRSGPAPSARTVGLLTQYDLSEIHEEDPAEALSQLQQELNEEPDLEKTYAFAELAYVQGKRHQTKGDNQQALQLFGAAVAHSYMYLFSPHLEEGRNPYDPQFREACDLYNVALEDLLRIVKAQGKLRPGENYELHSGEQRFDVQIVTRGLWGNDAFDRFEFASDYEVRGLLHRHVTYGVGVPLIAVRRSDDDQDPASGFYPRGMSVPVTAILRAVHRPVEESDQEQVVPCALELHDALASDVVDIANRFVPLETDLTTPLGYYLDNPEFQNSQIATWGLLDPSSTEPIRGLYMLEAFDPNKIPVVMVHGLWSSPETWTEMFNDLRSLPEIRNRYQFWSYLYPTGQPFWVSATEMRRDLEMVRQTVDPQRHWAALDQTVLIGHSMGGLVSRWQTLESEDRFWQVLSDKPFEELTADEETRTRLASMVFFKPNNSVRRVITLGTPHRGSTFANDYTRWLGRKLITLPATLVQTRTKIARDNPDFFQNMMMLTCTTSIDSLSPENPVLPAMLEASKAPWVRYHNVVGIVSKKKWLSRISERGDGVVSYESAHLDDVDSEIVVDADHVHVHQHPKAILEVRRILRLHSAEMYAEMAQRSAIPAAYQHPVLLPPVNNQYAPRNYGPRPSTQYRVTDPQNSASGERQMETYQ